MISQSRDLINIMDGWSISSHVNELCAVPFSSSSSPSFFSLTPTLVGSRAGSFSLPANYSVASKWVSNNVNTLIRTDGGIRTRVTAIIQYGSVPAGHTLYVRLMDDAGGFIAVYNPLGTPMDTVTTDSSGLYKRVVVFDGTKTSKLRLLLSLAGPLGSVSSLQIHGTGLFRGSQSSELSAPPFAPHYWWRIIWDSPNTDPGWSTVTDNPRSQDWYDCMEAPQTFISGSGSIISMPTSRSVQLTTALGASSWCPQPGMLVKTVSTMGTESWNRIAKVTVWDSSVPVQVFSLKDPVPSYPPIALSIYEEGFIGADSIASSTKDRVWTPHSHAQAAPSVPSVTILTHSKSYAVYEDTTNRVAATVGPLDSMLIHNTTTGSITSYDASNMPGYHYASGVHTNASWRYMPEAPQSVFGALFVHKTSDPRYISPAYEHYYESVYDSSGSVLSFSDKFWAGFGRYLWHVVLAAADDAGQTVPASIPTPPYRVVRILRYRSLA